jgi:cobalt/nickel transport system permease protein
VRTLEQWAHLRSPLHTVPASYKLVGLLLLLAGISLSRGGLLAALAAALLLLAILSRVPLGTLLRRAAVVLLFSASVAAITWITQGHTQAIALVIRSYLSAVVAVLFAATTTVPAWTTALAQWGVHRELIAVLHFLYRYLTVVDAEAQSMSTAARARGGLRFFAAAGLIGVLFARSWQRAQAIDQAMRARGAL